MNNYGKELILDITECEVTFTRDLIRRFFIDLCKRMDMKRADLHFWDYTGHPEEYENAPDHLKGISAIQFITTSNITIHTLDVSKQAMINIFSCKDFLYEDVTIFCARFFDGCIHNRYVIDRGE